MMKRVRKKRMRRGTAAQLQVPGPDQRMMEAVWWTEGVWTGPGEGWRGVRREWPEGRWRGVERYLQLEPVGKKPAAAQEEDKLDSPLPHPAASAEGRVQRDTGEGGVRVKSRWVVRGRWTVMGMEVQEQAQVLMENLQPSEPLTSAFQTSSPPPLPLPPPPALPEPRAADSAHLSSFLHCLQSPLLPPLPLHVLLFAQPLSPLFLLYSVLPRPVCDAECM